MQICGCQESVWGKYHYVLSLFSYFSVDICPWMLLKTGYWARLPLYSLESKQLESDINPHQFPFPKLFCKQKCQLILRVHQILIIAFCSFLQHILLRSICLHFSEFMTNNQSSTWNILTRPLVPASFVWERLACCFFLVVKSHLAYGKWDLMFHAWIFCRNSGRQKWAVESGESSKGGKVYSFVSNNH